MSLRELPPQDELVKARDHASIVVLPPAGWDCLYCLPPSGSDGAATTVEWLPTGGPDGAEFGRCRECGQKYVLAEVTQR